MSAIKSYPVVALERISYQPHLMNESQKVGRFFPPVKNEPNPKRLNSGIKDSIVCQVKTEIKVAPMQRNAVPNREHRSITTDLVAKIKEENEESVRAAMQGNSLPKREHPSVTSDLVVKIKEENEELVSYCNASPVRKRQEYLRGMKCGSDSEDGDFCNLNVESCSDDEPVSAVKGDDRIASKTSGKSTDSSQTQQTKSRESSNVKLLEVSVELQDLFPSSVRKLGKAHSNDGPCCCIFCRGEYRLSSYCGSGESLKHCQSQIQLTRSQYSSANIRDPSKCRKNSVLITSRSACSSVVGVKLDKCSAEPRKRGTVFNCKECPAKIKSPAKFQIHLRVHSGERSFKCKLCPAKFNQRGNLKGHHMRVHSNIRPFECKQCPAKFVTRSLLINHSRIHTGEKPFECPQCHRKFTLKQNMRAHIKTVHSDVKPFKCAQCPAAFKLKDYLRNHFRMHSGEKPFKCEQCPSRFISSWKLKDHSLHVHTIIRAFACAHCPSKFKAKGALTTHLKIHSSERPFSCAECTSKFKSKRELRNHIVGMHTTTEKQLKCKLCPALFKRSSALWRHSKYAHSDSRPFKCELCPSRFNQRSNLRVHLRRHSDVRAFKCDQCRATFKTKGELVRHVRIHSCVKAFKCHHCPASFMEGSHLLKHLKLHTGDRPFKCKKCSANYSQSGHLVKHLKKVHRFKP